MIGSFQGMKVIIFLVILLLISPILPVNTTGDVGSDIESTRSRSDIIDQGRGTIYTHDDKEDLINGTRSNLVFNEDGHLRLGQINRYLHDDFLNDDLISESSFIYLDQIQGYIENRPYTIGGEMVNGEGNNILFSSDGSVVIVGYTLNPAPDYYDILVIKVDNRGDVDWSREIDIDNSHEWGCDLLETGDGGFLVLGYSDKPSARYDAVLMKLDKFGKTSWTEKIDIGGMEFARFLKEGKDGYYYIGGHQMKFGTANNSFFLVKVNSLGKSQWKRTYDLNPGNEPRGMAVDPAGNVTMIGWTGNSSGTRSELWCITIGEDGEEIRNCTLSRDYSLDRGASIISCDNGDLLLSGITGSDTGDFESPWLIRINSTGSEIWNRTYDLEVTSDEMDIITDSSGFQILMNCRNQSSGEEQIFLVSIDEDGFLTDIRSYEGRGDDIGSGIAKMDGRYAITGITVDSVTKEWNVLLMILNETGSFQGGHLESWNLMFGEEATTLYEFEAYSRIDAKSSVEVSFSMDGDVWVDGEGVVNGSHFLKSGSTRIPLNESLWKRSSFFYRVIFNPSSEDFLTLYEVKLRYRKYHDEGFFISPVIDCETAANLMDFEWDIESSAWNFAGLQIKGDMSEGMLERRVFTGYDGSPSTYYEERGEFWYDLGEVRYVQYKVTFTTTRLFETPLLKAVSIHVNRIPEVSNFTFSPDLPDIDSAISLNISYRDLDGDPPEMMLIFIDGKKKKMERLEGSEGFTEWVELSYEHNLSAGNHSIYISYSDWAYHEETDIEYLLVSEGPLFSIEIDPENMNCTTDDLIRFSARGYDRHHNRVDLDPIWSVSGGGEIDAEGIYDPSRPGSWMVTASNGNIIGTVFINVTRGRLDSMLIIPQTSEVTTDEMVVYRVICMDSDGNIFELSPVWDLSGGGNLSQDGIFIPMEPGEWIIRASIGIVKAEATLTISVGSLDHIVITSDRDFIMENKTAYLRARGYDRVGNPIDIDPIWEVDGGGIIDDDGKFHGLTPGNWTIFANYSGISGNFIIEVIGIPEIEPDVNPVPDDVDPIENSGLNVPIWMIIVPVFLVLIIIVVISFFTTRYALLRKKQKMIWSLGEGEEDRIPKSEYENELNWK